MFAIFYRKSCISSWSYFKAKLLIFTLSVSDKRKKPFRISWYKDIDTAVSPLRQREYSHSYNWCTNITSVPNVMLSDFRMRGETCMFIYSGSVLYSDNMPACKSLPDKIYSPFGLEVDYSDICHLHEFIFLIDDYAEDGGPGPVWTSSSFNHNPLRH